LDQPTVETFQLNNEAVSALIHRIGDGDKSALGTLYDKTNRLLFGLIIKMVEDRAAAEEVLLDVYTRVWKQSRAYNPKITTPLEWLIIIARSRAIIHLHRNKQYIRKQRTAQSGVAELEMSVAPERQKLARDSLEALAPIQREILEWAYYSGLSCSEIAAQAGKPVGAIRTHARLGLSKLTELFHQTFNAES
jgi:RNA polymerase sigma-70 factor, ECF subfamily